MLFRPVTLLTLASALAHATAFAQAPAQPPAQAPAQTPPPITSATPDGTSGPSTFHDDTLHVTYNVPAGYLDASAIVSTAFKASTGNDPAAAASARCITLPFSRMSTNGDMNIVMMLRADATCLKRKFTAQSVEELAQGEAKGIAATGAKTSFGPSTSFEVDHHPASALQGFFTLPTGQTLQSRVVCALDQPDILCWQFLAATPEGLATMSAFPVTFDNGKPTPLTTPKVP